MLSKNIDFLIQLSLKNLQFKILHRQGISNKSLKCFVALNISFSLGIINLINETVKESISETLMKTVSNNFFILLRYIDYFCLFSFV